MAPERDGPDVAALFEELYADLVRFAARRVGPNRAADLAADVFVIAWRRRTEIPAGRERQWLYTVALNLCRNTARRQRTEQQLLSDLVAEYEVLGRPDTGLNRESDAAVEPADVAAAFDSLTPDQQEVLRTSDWDGLAPRDAAALLGCSSGAYRVRLHRARSALRKAVERVTETQNAGPRESARIDLPVPAATQPHRPLVKGIER